MKLNLGSRDRHAEGFTSVDISGPADVICDLSERWPWEDSTVDEVLAFSIFEHLPNKLHTMNELWRVMKPGARAHLQLPHATLGDGGHCDPTHKSYWTTSDFEYYHPGVAEYERFHEAYGVKACFRVLNLNESGHIPLSKYPRKFGGYVTEFNVILGCVK